jgi:hypothetical protein
VFGIEATTNHASLICHLLAQSDVDKLQSMEDGLDDLCGVRWKGERSIDLSVPTYSVPAAATSGGGGLGSFTDSRHTTDDVPHSPRSLLFSHQ